MADLTPTEGAIDHETVIIRLVECSTSGRHRAGLRKGSRHGSQSLQPSASLPTGSSHCPSADGEGGASFDSAFCTMLFLPRWIFAYSLSETT